MTLRTKTLLLTVATILILIAVLYVASQLAISWHYQKLEEQDTLEDVERAVVGLSHRVSSLDMLLSDWSSWDDTYEFMLTGDREYIDSNMVDETFEALTVNFIILAQPSGDVAFSKAFDLSERKEIPLPASLREHLSENDLLISHSGTQSAIAGLLSLPEGQMIVSSRPVLTSEDEEPVVGSMIMGRFLDEEEIGQIAYLSQLSLETRQPSDPDLPPDFEAAQASMSHDRPTAVQVLSEEAIAGYALIEDIYGNGALLLKVEMPRPIFEQLQTTRRNLMLGIIVGGVLVLLLILALLERTVLSRVTRLSKSVVSIGESGDLTARVPVSGNDELSRLGDSINRMLAALQESHCELKKSEERNRAILETIPDTMLLLDKGGTILNYKPANDGGGTASAAEMTGKGLREVMHKEVAEQAVRHLQQALETGDTQVFECSLPQEGEMRDFEARMVPSGEGEVLTMMRDITERKRAEERNQHYTKRVEALYSVAQALSQTTAMEDLLDNALARVVEVMGTDTGTIYILDTSQKALVLKAQRGMGDESISKVATVKLDDEEFERILQWSDPNTPLSQLQSESTLESVSAALEEEGIQASAAVPLSVRGRLEGVLSVNSRERREFTADDMSLLTAIGNEIGVGIQNAGLLEKTKELSITDELTQLYNRRHFYGVLDAEISRIQRYGGRFSLVMLDLDGFKEYNDNFGHTTGDSILRSVAETITSSLRETDTAFRYGGDEFAVVLPATDAGNSRRIIDRIREKWSRALEKEHVIQESPLGFSAGIAQFPEDAETADGLVMLADAALYNSKKVGRHTTTLASELKA